MYIKQLSIFIENKAGRLEDMLGILKDNGINLVSLSLADTSDYGVLRLLVSDPENGKAALKAAGVSCKTTDVLAVKLAHKVGQLQELLEVICKAGINIEYMYALATGKDDASIVIKPSDIARAEELLKEAGVEFVTQEDLANI